MLISKFSVKSIYFDDPNTFIDRFVTRLIPSMEFGTDFKIAIKSDNSNDVIYVQPDLFRTKIGQMISSDCEKDKNFDICYPEESVLAFLHFRDVIFISIDIYGIQFDVLDKSLSEYQKMLSLDSILRENTISRYTLKGHTKVNLFETYLSYIHRNLGGKDLFRFKSPISREDVQAGLVFLQHNILPVNNIYDFYVPGSSTSEEESEDVLGYQNPSATLIKNPEILTDCIKLHEYLFVKYRHEYLSILSKFGVKTDGIGLEGGI